MASISDGEKIIVSLEERLLGRTCAEDIKDANGNVVIPASTVLDRKDIEKVAAAKVHEVIVRSPLTCELDYGICQKCYGWALTSNRIVDIGEAIGIVAAQSIGEPGTQLTMRTFHTGGVFKGTASMRQVKTEVSGKVVSKLATRELRTRHGDVVQVSTKDTKIEIEDKNGKKSKYNIPYAAILYFNEGAEVKKGDVIAEFEPATGQGDGGRLTEKASKDITSDISGEIGFDGFVVDEKRDRQGNISRTANRGGTVWVLAGDVYNLPGGSKITVKDEQQVIKGEILAETSTISEHGGEVRIGEDLIIEDATVDGKKIKKIVSGKELTIVIASIMPSNAVLESTKKELIWHVEETGEKYIIKSPADTMVENGMIIAELIDEENTVTSSGEIRYAGIEVDEHQIITTPGKILFIPEEIHQVSKDSTLKMVETGTYVKAGTEIVKDVTCHIDGVVEIKEYNDIIHEVIIRPGELHTIANISALKVEEGEIVEAGIKITADIKAKEKCIVSILSPNGSHSGDFEISDIDEEFEESEHEEKEPEDVNVDILLRPVQEFDIAPREVSIDFSSTESDLIDIVPVTQLQYRDGGRVRQLDGAALTRTSLVLQMQGYLSHLKGMVELEQKKQTENIKIVVLETLIVRREIESSTAGVSPLQTELLVKHGQTIEPKTPVAKTQVLALCDAVVSRKKPENQESRRLLLISENSETEVTLKTKPVVKAGDLIRVDQVISESGEISTISGKIIEVKKNTLKIRVGRPYLISPGTQLQVDASSLVQRGDLLATLVFERQKTGDIVQGLPRVEELLEGRKPKESAILAEENGVAEIEYEEEVPRLFLATENGRQEIKFTIDSNIIVTDKLEIKKGQPLTSGPLNPHDVIRLSGVEAVQQYLVDEVQRVYRSQGVEIADKHIETIVRQMTKKVKVDESGDTKLLPGELAEIHNVEAENAEVEKLGGQLATYHSVLLGITKASLNTESFISAASFQETTRILSEVAVEGKKDQLRGLKENVIIGRLIPAGTGFYHLHHASEAEEEASRKNLKAAARKPSAILEEIEGMFGSPDFTIE
jgi:DNA-directed RNA polymerase subunit beta'